MTRKPSANENFRLSTLSYWSAYCFNGSEVRFTFIIFIGSVLFSAGALVVAPSGWSCAAKWIQENRIRAGSKNSFSFMVVFLMKCKYRKMIEIPERVLTGKHEISLNKTGNASFY
jgi:hypothetical protein